MEAKRLYQTNKNPAEQIAYSPVQAARLLGMSNNGIYNMIAAGKLPTVKLGNKVLISKAWLVAFLAGEVTHQKAASREQRKSPVSETGPDFSTERQNSNLQGIYWHVTRHLQGL